MYGDIVAETLTPAELKARLEALTTENARLQQILQKKEEEDASNVRLITAGESAAMVVHEALNPITAIISRLQHALDDESELQLLNIILNEWDRDFREGGVELLMKSLSEPAEDGTLMLEEDLHNLCKGLEDNQRNLEFFLKQLKRVVLILNSLRGLARTESTVVPYNIKDAIEMTAELMEDSLKKRKIQLIQNIDHRSWVMIDENEFVQILHNLARNAMQALVKNGTITISTKEQNGRLEIRIQDTGPGIPPEIVDKIFMSRFTTKSKQEGTGLGLSFSQRMMRKYNGDLILESPGGNGNGAVFLCWLPVVPNQTI